jgi:MtN3 and saliva related transmembrane protein
MTTDALGWLAATILLLTVGRQVYTQWRDKTCLGVSHWLFIGQIAASVSFVAYSWLLGNWVFVVTNGAMLVVAVLGQIIYLRNRRRDGGASSAVSAPIR